LYFLIALKYFCFLFLVRFIFKNPAISAHFARSRQSPVHHTWIRQILARFTARVLLRPGVGHQWAALLADKVITLCCWIVVIAGDVYQMLQRG
jgi:hypothetical protein